MKLTQLATAEHPIPVKRLGRDVKLAKEVQRRLAVLGCLDPPADGEFGPVSSFALGRFARHEHLPFDDALTPKIATALLDEKPETFIPLRLGTDLASRIVKYMQLRGYFIARLPNFLNIVYVEGSDAKGTPNKDRLDKWNDRRIILRIDPTGRPVLDLNVVATTEPGRKFTLQPLNPEGAARIALDQFKAWRIGFHHPNLTPPRKHRALVQAGPIRIFRDKNEDGSRKGDIEQVGSGFGINQHSGHDAASTSIGDMSAGCLVARLDADHQEFMRQVRRDPRYAKASDGYMFMTTIISGRDLAAKVPSRPGR